MHEKIPESVQHFDRIIGNSGAGKGVAKGLEAARASGVERIVSRATISAKVGKWNAKETGEADKQLFLIAANYVQQFAAQYGANKRESSSDILNSIDRADDAIMNGSYDIWSGNIKIQEGTDIEKLTTMIHELLHRSSFHSVTLVNKSPEEKYWLSDINLRRSGIGIFPGNKEERNKKNEKVREKKQKKGLYFEALEEAITEECNRRIWKQIVEDPRFKERFKSSEDVKKLLRAKLQLDHYSKAYIDDKMNDVLFIEDADKIMKTFRSPAALKSLDSLLDQIACGAQGDTKILFAERWGERNTLRGIIDELFEKGGERFKDKEEVFRFFADAHFTGQILPLARMVDGILGKGAFRKMAEDTASGELKTKSKE